MAPTRDYRNQFGLNTYDDVNDPSATINSVIDELVNGPWSPFDDESTLFNAYDLNGATVPSGSLSKEVEERVIDAEEYLQNNYSDYDVANCCVVVDHWNPEVDGPNGIGYTHEVGGRGKEGIKTTLVDFQIALDNTQLKDSYDNSKIWAHHTAHEIGHVYCGLHRYAAFWRNGSEEKNKGTVMGRGLHSYLGDCTCSGNTAPESWAVTAYKYSQNDSDGDTCNKGEIQQAINDPNYNHDDVCN